MEPPFFAILTLPSEAPNVALEMLTVPPAYMAPPLPFVAWLLVNVTPFSVRLPPSATYMAPPSPRSLILLSNVTPSIWAVPATLKAEELFPVNITFSDAILRVAPVDT